MNARWHRAVAGLGLALAAALLSGCHAQGTFDVLSEDRVAVDLFVTGADVNCPHGADELKLTVTTTIDQYGDQVCHVTGETQATYFSTFGITITPAAEYLVMQANLAGGRDSWPASDIDIRFPGRVMDASLGVVTDNVVRITDLEALTQGSGLRAVGLRSAGPPQWMIAGLTGVGAGIVLTLIVGLVVLLVRRPRRDPLAPLEYAFPELDAAAASPRAPLTVVAPVAPMEPVTAASAGPPPPKPEDTSWFARPPANGDATNATAVHGQHRHAEEPNGARAAHPKHTAWAPPPEPSGDQRAG